ERERMFERGSEAVLPRGHCRAFHGGSNNGLRFHSVVPFWFQVRMFSGLSFGACCFLFAAPKRCFTLSVRLAGAVWAKNFRSSRGNEAQIRGRRSAGRSQSLVTS